MKIRVRTAIEGPNARGLYRALMIVDNEINASSRWMSEKGAFHKLDLIRSELLIGAQKHGLTITFNKENET